MNHTQADLTADLFEELLKLEPADAERLVLILKGLFVCLHDLHDRVLALEEARGNPPAPIPDA